MWIFNFKNLVFIYYLMNITTFLNINDEFWWKFVKICKFYHWKGNNFKFVWNPRKSSQGMIILLMRSLDYIHIFIWRNSPEMPPHWKSQKLPLLRTGSIATQFGIKLNLVIRHIPLVQTSVWDGSGSTPFAGSSHFLGEKALWKYMRRYFRVENLLVENVKNILKLKHWWRSFLYLQRQALRRAALPLTKDCDNESIPPVLLCQHSLHGLSWLQICNLQHALTTHALHVITKTGSETGFPCEMLFKFSESHLSSLNLLLSRHCKIDCCLGPAQTMLHQWH